MKENIFSHDVRDRKFYEEVYNLLMYHAGAEEGEKEAFLLSFTRVHPFELVYQFSSYLGHGTKVWRYGGKIWITCYDEDLNHERRKILATLNNNVSFLRKKYNPKC